MLELLLNNNFLSSIIAFAIILIPAIIIHELGHFVAAKMVGINVLEFGIGFPPRAARLFVWGETEFTLNWLPIGGFVRPLGEDMIGPVVEEQDDYEFDDDDYDEDKPKNIAYISEREELMSRGVPEHKLQSVNDTSPWGRIWFMVAGAVFNVVSAIIFFIIAALAGIPIEQGARVQIAEISDTSQFNQAEVYTGDAIELVDGEYFASHTAFFNYLTDSNGTVELTMRHPDNFEAIENQAGERYVITITPDIEIVTPSVFITAIVEDSPAEDAGMLPGDRIIAVQGQRLSVNDPIGDLLTVINDLAGTSINLVILRDGSEQVINLIPRLDPEPNQGRVGVGIVAQWESSDGVYFQNANPQMELVPQSLGASIEYGFTRTWTVLSLMAELPAQLISGAISPEQARPVSIVGISQIGGSFLQQSIRDGSPAMVLDFIALISIFLGITNLLPIPALDGGRILFVFIEIIRGKPIPAEIESRINLIAISILLALGVIVIIFDIFNPIDLAQ
ncbi:MAG: hypothetical protein Phog2KO_03670 [Phototrophicaceae bacterium]